VAWGAAFDEPYFQAYPPPPGGVNNSLTSAKYAAWREGGSGDAALSPPIPWSVLLIALGLGLALFAGISIVGKISGGHYNPAVTVFFGHPVNRTVFVVWYLIGPRLGVRMRRSCRTRYSRGGQKQWP